MQVKVTSQQCNRYQNDLSFHRKAVMAFYGLTFLFVGTLGVLAAGIYRDWQILTHRMVAIKICPTFFASHPLHALTMPLLLALFFCIFYLFLRSLLAQLSAFRCLKEQVGQAQTTCPAKVNYLVAETGMRCQLVCLESSIPFAFTYGFLHPKIVFSQALVSVLGENELLAVLLHEYHHIRSHDPVKTLLSRAIGAALFFLPLARYLALRYEQARELAADQAAVTASGGGLHLSSALLKVIRHSPELDTSVSLVETKDTIGLRIIQLVSPNEAVNLDILPGRQAAATLVLFLGLLAAFLSGCV